MKPGECCEHDAQTFRRASGRVVGLVAAALAIITCLALPASAQTPTAKSNRLSVSNEADFARLDQAHRLRTLIKLIKRGHHQLAERLLAKYPFTGARAENRTLFIQGKILKARGDLDGAVDNYRSVLASDPDLSLVRMELAHTLYLMEEDTGAKHHLELLKASAPTVETSKQFDRFIDTIDARRPWSFDAYVSIAPSTNYNNGTNENPRDFLGLRGSLSDANRPKSGIGFRGGANGSYVHRAGPGVDFIVGAGINATNYERHIYDDLILSQSAMLRKRHDRGSITGGFVLTERWLGYGEFYWSLAPQFAVYHRLAPTISSYTKFRHTIINYEDTDYRSGQKFTVEERLGKAFSAGTIFYLTAGGERSLTKRDYLDYWAGFGGLGLYYEAPMGLTLYAETEVRRQIHDADYPGLSKNRKDTRLDVSVSLHKRDFDIMGLTPQLHYSYIRNFSNSPIDRYETHGANITLTKKF